MSVGTVRQIHAILSGAFVTAVRWEWITRNPAASAKLPNNRRQPAVALSPSQVAKVIAVAQDVHPELATYLWLVAVTGARRGELCGLWWADLDLQVGSVHVVHNYLVRGGQRIRKDTKTHQDRRLAIDRVTCDVLAAHRQRAVEALAAVGLIGPTVFKSVRGSLSIPCFYLDFQHLRHHVRQDHPVHFPWDRT
jgi:integrase